MLLAVEAHHRVVHSQQHLDVVVVFLRVPPLALRLGKLVLDEIQGRRELADAKVCHCKIRPGQKQVKGSTVWLFFFLVIA